MIQTTKKRVKIYTFWYLCSVISLNWCFYTPVSYTHLDVYKRQSVSGISSQSPASEVEAEEAMMSDKNGTRIISKYVSAQRMPPRRITTASEVRHIFSANPFFLRLWGFFSLLMEEDCFPSVGREWSFPPWNTSSSIFGRSCVVSSFSWPQCGHRPVSTSSPVSYTHLVVDCNNPGWFVWQCHNQRDQLFQW